MNQRAVQEQSALDQSEHCDSANKYINKKARKEGEKGKWGNDKEIVNVEKPTGNVDRVRTGCATPRNNGSLRWWTTLTEKEGGRTLNGRMGKSARREWSRGWIRIDV